MKHFPLTDEEIEILQQKERMRMSHCGVLRREHRRRHPRAENLWMHKARHIRTESVLRLKNRIRSDNLRDDTDRLFFTHSIFLDDFPLSWVDVDFPSVLDKGLRFHAFIQTAQMKFSDAVEMQAINETFGRLSPEEKKAEDAWDMVPAEKDKLTGKVLSWREARETRPVHASLGKTFHEAVEERRAELFASLPFIPEDSVTLKETSYGVRLDVSIAKLTMFTEDINAFIRRFRENGEKGWKRELSSDDPCLLRDKDWMGILKMSPGLMVGNWTPREVPKWAKGGPDIICTVKDLKKAISDEKNAENPS